MKFTGVFVKPKMDLDQYRTMLDKYLRETVAQAIMEWLEATVIAEVPVWSGASRATFLQLARNIEYNIPIAPVAPSREDQGLAQSFGDLDAGKTKAGRHVFTYQTTLPWLCINEYYDATQWGFHLKKPGPYNFQKKGVTAFHRFAETVHLPNPFRCLKTTRISVR